MARAFARFAAAPIGPSMAVRDGGLSLVTTADGIDGNRNARSDVGYSTGLRGAEFTLWGDADLFADIGVVLAGATYAAPVGLIGVAWALHIGQIYVNGVSVASGLPAVAKGEIIGVALQLDGGSPTIAFYKGNTLVHARAIAPGTWHFAATIAPPTAGGLVCVVNAGQWQAATPAAAAAWPAVAGASANAKLSDWDYLSAATDAPAHARYEGLLLEGVTTGAEIGFWPWSGDPPVRSGSATTRAVDADGILDALAMQDLRGTPVAIKLGERDGTVAAAATVARYVIERIEVQGDASKLIILADAHDDLDLPITRGQFLPNVPALAWSPQPVVIGAVASVPGLVANSDGTVMFLSDSPLAHVSAVMDRGDLMEAGTFALAPDSQQLTMTSPPVGPVVCDVSSIGAAMQPATLLQFLHAAFGRIGKTSWSSADAAAIDAATGYAGIGYYTREGGDVGSVRQALARVLPSYGAWWWQDDDGTLRFARIIAPETYVGELAFEVERGHMASDLIFTPDYAPNLTRRMSYRPNAQALSAADLVTDMVDVPQARRDELTALWRGVAYSGSALPARYQHADSAEPMQSAFWRAQDAQTEIDRVVGMYGVPRFSMVATFKGDPTFAPKPGQVGRITYSRYAELAGGKKVLVRGRTRNPATGDITLILWG
ncbi:hypothetical protein [Pseudoxanthomonas sp.]|uniref:hypothetical protein n=1 Tax=Pseudoxanthomonas sp. TaxID=1871049 RepID=UPI0025F48022|nr:hypothetical protein [Pseudoxanthomonas sp.]